jgi:hypothetical protein
MQNARRASDDEKIITAKMKIFPVLVHALSSSSTITDFNGFIRIMEGGAYFYLPVNEQDLTEIKNMNPYTDLICGSPKRSIKGNATQTRFLVEVPEDELDEEVVQYLNKNSLVMLKVMCKDIEMCGEPVVVPAAPVRR